MGKGCCEKTDIGKFISKNPKITKGDFLIFLFICLLLKMADKSKKTSFTTTLKVEG